MELKQNGIGMVLVTLFPVFLSFLVEQRMVLPFGLHSDVPRLEPPGRARKPAGRDHRHPRLQAPRMRRDPEAMEAIPRHQRWKSDI